MNKLNLTELEDPKKLAELLGCEMVELANAIRGISGGIPSEVLQRLERCLLLAGMAAGLILRDQRQDTEAELAEIHQILDYAANHGVSKFDLIDALRGDSEKPWISAALGQPTDSTKE